MPWENMNEWTASQARVSAPLCCRIRSTVTLIQYNSRAKRSAKVKVKVNSKVVCHTWLPRPPPFLIHPLGNPMADTVSRLSAL